MPEDPQVKLKEPSLFEDIADAVWNGILKPTFTNLTYNCITEAARVGLFGKNGAPNPNIIAKSSTVITSNSKIDYTKMYDKSIVSTQLVPTTTVTAQPQYTSNSVCNLEVPSYSDAVLIRDAWVDIINDRTYIDVCSFYAYLRDNIESCSTLPILQAQFNGYGWTQSHIAMLREIRPSQKHPGHYIVSLPRMTRVNVY